ncbi:hypothetical protein C0J45_0029 [Silurus meridionalis]|nr:hypothetical protein C0J45_0029 [Silurus meridionalis]
MRSNWSISASRMIRCSSPSHHITSRSSALVDTVWAVWSIGASIYDYINTSAMEERIHSLESAITLHERVIGLLTVALVALVTYILLRKH